MRLKAKSRGSAFIRLNNDTTRCAPCVNVVLFVCVWEQSRVSSPSLAGKERTGKTQRTRDDGKRSAGLARQVIQFLVIFCRWIPIDRIRDAKWYADVPNYLNIWKNCHPNFPPSSLILFFPSNVLTCHFFLFAICWIIEKGGKLILWV